MEGQIENPDNIRKAVLILAVSLILGLIFNSLFFEKYPSLGFPVYTLLAIIGLFVISRVAGKEIHHEAKWLLVPIVFFSVMLFWRTSVMLNVLNIISVVLLLIIVAALSHGKRLREYLIPDYFRVLVLPLEFIFDFFGADAVIARHLSGRNDPAVSRQIKRGIAITIPFLLIFLFLFSSADLVYNEYLREIFDIKIETLFRLFWIVFVTCVFIGAYSYIFIRKRTEVIELQPQPVHRTMGEIESSILLGSVNVLFLTFVLIQLKYLFGGESNIAAQGFTYAEYARQGFGELLTVAIITLFLLLITEKNVRAADSRHTVGYKLLSTALVVQVTLIMASAFMRLLMYEKAYGFTTLRLYSHSFIIWLAVVFLLLLVKIFIDRKESPFALRVFISILMFMAFMNLLNPDAFIARRNIERYYSTGQLDSAYLGRLSDDAVPVILGSLDYIQDDKLERMSRDLVWRYSERTTSTYYVGWQSINLSRMRAVRLLGDKIDEIESLIPEGEKISMAR